MVRRVCRILGLLFSSYSLPLGVLFCFVVVFDFILFSFCFILVWFFAVTISVYSSRSIILIVFYMESFNFTLKHFISLFTDLYRNVTQLLHR